MRWIWSRRVPHVQLPPRCRTAQWSPAAAGQRDCGSGLQLRCIPLCNALSFLHYACLPHALPWLHPAHPAAHNQDPSAPPLRPPCTQREADQSNQKRQSGSASSSLMRRYPPSSRSCGRGIGTTAEESVPWCRDGMSKGSVGWEGWLEAGPCALKLQGHDGMLMGGAAWAAAAGAAPAAAHSCTPQECPTCSRLDSTLPMLGRWMWKRVLRMLEALLMISVA